MPLTRFNLGVDEYDPALANPDYQGSYSVQEQPRILRSLSDVGAYEPRESLTVEAPRSVREASPSSTTQRERKTLESVKQIKPYTFLEKLALRNPQYEKFVRERSVREVFPLAARELQQQLNSSLLEGDLDTADDLINQFTPVAQRSDAAHQFQKSLQDRVNTLRTQKEANLAISEPYKSRIKGKGARESLESLESNAHRIPTAQYQEELKRLFPKIEIQGGRVTAVDPLDASIQSTNLLPPTIDVKDLPKSVEQALVTRGIPTQLYTYVQNQVNNNTASPSDRFLYEQFNNAIGGLAARNVVNEQYPISEQIKGRVTPQRAKAITTGDAETPAPTPSRRASISSSVATPTYYTATVRTAEGEEGTIEVTDPNLLAPEALAKEGLTLASPSITKSKTRTTQAQGATPLGTPTSSGNLTSEVRQQQIEDEAETAGRREAAIQTNRRATEGFPVGTKHYTIDNKGRVKQYQGNPSIEQATRLGLFSATKKEDEKAVEAYGSLREQGAQILQSLPTYAKEIAKKGNFSRAASQIIAKGGEFNLVNVGGNRIGVNIDGVGGVALSDNEQKLLIRLAGFVEAMKSAVDPEDKKNALLGHVTGLLSNSLSGAKSIENAIRGVLEIAEDNVRGRFRASGATGVGEVPIPPPSLPNPATPPPPSGVVQEGEAGLTDFTANIIKGLVNLFNIKPGEQYKPSPYTYAPEGNPSLIGTFKQRVKEKAIDIETSRKLRKLNE